MTMTCFHKEVTLTFAAAAALLESGRARAARSGAIYRSAMAGACAVAVSILIATPARAFVVDINVSIAYNLAGLPLSGNFQIWGPPYEDGLPSEMIPSLIPGNPCGRETLGRNAETLGGFLLAGCRSRCPLLALSRASSAPTIRCP
jgi:hypothetical protein